MILNFAEALKELGPNAAFRIARETRPTSDYLLTRYLPEMTKPSYSVESGNMVIRATMAGQSGMDSPYPEGGIIEASKFLAKTSKITNQVTMPEQALRELQELMYRLEAGNSNDTVDMVEEALNFLEKLVIQPHWDTMEYLKGQIFTTGKIDWTFNNLKVNVDYEVPSGNFLPNRTGSDAYDGTSSKFWSDMRELQSILDYDVEVYLTHPDTMNLVLDNENNNIEILEQESYKYGTRYRIAKLVGSSDVRRSSDTRDTISVITYGAEGELIDPNNPKQTKQVPFLTVGKIIAIATDNQEGYVPGEGSTDSPERDRVLGYTHIGPTTEGGGQLGRWARLYTPEDYPMQLRGQGVTNGLPVVEAPKKIAVASTDMP